MSTFSFKIQARTQKPPYSLSGLWRIQGSTNWLHQIWLRFSKWAWRFPMSERAWHTPKFAPMFGVCTVFQLIFLIFGWPIPPWGCLPSISFFILLHAEVFAWRNVAGKNKEGMSFPGALRQAWHARNIHDIRAWTHALLRALEHWWLYQALRIARLSI